MSTGEIKDHTLSGKKLDRVAPLVLMSLILTVIFLTNNKNFELKLINMILASHNMSLTKL